jgi:hypothetical protein
MTAIARAPAPPATPNALAQRAAFALDPVAWARHAVGVELDPWQQEMARALACGRNIAVAASRQSGKSFTTALTAAWLVSAGYWPGVKPHQPPPLVLAVAPSQRQAGEWAERARQVLQRAGVRLATDNALELVVKGGGRIVVAPAGTSSRGYSADLAIAEEAGYLSDDDIAVLAATVAATGGVRALISSPSGPTGAFADAVLKPSPGWLVLRVPYTMCSRLSPDFIAERRARMRRVAFSNEFEASFEGDEGAVFERSALDALMADADDADQAPPLPARGSLDNLMVA